MATRDKLHVEVERRFNAPPEEVFDAWLDPASLSRWMFGPAVRDEDIVRLTLDPRVGGEFAFMVRRQGQEITHVGRYLQINRPRRLLFTWGIAGVSEDQSRVMVDILPVGSGCDLSLSQELRPHLAEYAARTDTGWIHVLDLLSADLEAQSRSE